MKVRLLSPSGDYSFGNGNLNFIQNTPETVAQVTQTSCQLFLGEFFLDTTAGLPYPESVLGKHSQDEADATITGYINNVQGVISITNYQSTIDPNTRTYASISGTLNTVYGPTPLEIQNESNF